ncbi:hypothetical protein TSUD_26120 [Trifolium subterraneum]|uniref:Uncharacterized protein n=1 Tax=Trifolium subterraneum TaxID=3900 RepID=A0A2Z6NYR8_TRISU|nr:hypothetical protein TSUD_26120 [Trifolium subterraneum]
MPFLNTDLQTKSDEELASLKATLVSYDIVPLFHILSISLQLARGHAGDMSSTLYQHGINLRSAEDGKSCFAAVVRHSNASC